MAIQSLTALNVAGFSQRKNAWLMEESNHDEQTYKQYTHYNALQIDFSDGINILLGENGTGKTTILKMIYTATQCSLDSQNKHSVLRYFSANRKEESSLRNHHSSFENAFFQVSTDTASFTYHLASSKQTQQDTWTRLDIPAVFIPTMELLTYAKVIQSHDRTCEFPFDQTQQDIIKNALFTRSRSSFHRKRRTAR